MHNVRVESLVTLYQQIDDAAITTPIIIQNLCPQDV
jgi:hypothetical protein